MTEHLTPEHLRSWGRQWGHVVQLQSYPSTGRVVKDAASKFADAWDRDRREIERLRAERDELRRENKILKEDCERLRLYHQAKDELGRVAEKMVEGMESPADDIGLPSSELWKLYETDEPTWLPAPDTQPADLADAQMVTVRDQNGIPMHDIAAAAEIAWGRWEIYYEYRPLYSDSGLPLCSPEGLHEDTKYVATDNDGCVFQYRTKPHFPEDRLYWWLSDSFIGRAPSSHRRPGLWSESLMEVTRQ